MTERQPRDLTDAELGYIVTLLRSLLRDGRPIAVARAVRLELGRHDAERVRRELNPPDEPLVFDIDERRRW